MGKETRGKTRIRGRPFLVGMRIALVLYHLLFRVPHFRVFYRVQRQGNSGEWIDDNIILSETSIDLSGACGFSIIYLLYTLCSIVLCALCSISITRMELSERLDLDASACWSLLNGFEVEWLP